MQTQTIQRGTILIARPSLLTDVFHRSVVIITTHSEESGSIGFVLNKSLNIPVNVFLSDINSNSTVYSGGPVDEENIFYIHNRPDLIKNSEPIKDNLYWAGDFDDVKYALNNGYIKANEIRFYVGYSGWSEHQLETEIKNGAWSVHNSINFDVFAEWDHKLWKEQMIKLGGENLLWFNMPENPMLN